MGKLLSAGALALTILVVLPLGNTMLSSHHCNLAPEWSSRTFNPRDCDIAISDFLRRKVLVHGDSAVEFVRVGTKPRSRLPTVSTPQKYQAGEANHQFPRFVISRSEKLTERNPADLG